MQKSDGRLFLISYASRKLLDREKCYAAIEKECFVIVWAVKEFDVYLFGRHFVIQTDHNTLTHIDRVKFDSSRIMRWAMFLH